LIIFKTFNFKTFKKPSELLIKPKGFFVALAPKILA